MFELFRDEVLRQIIYIFALEISFLILMRTKLIQILYSLTAFLADRTKGFPLFSKWKIALGSLLIGLSISSCKEKTKPTNISPDGTFVEKVTKCYETSLHDSLLQIPPPPVEVSTMCYFIPPVITESNETIDTSEVPFDQNDTLTHQIIDPVETKSVFPGGEEAMFQFIEENMKYPEEAIQNKIEGRVYVRFVIERNGTINNIEVRKSPDESLSKEAVRIIKMMPKWIPSKQMGAEVSSSFMLPINFKLEDNEN